MTGAQIVFDSEETTVTRGETVTFRVEDSAGASFHVVSKSVMDLRERPTGPTAVENVTGVLTGTEADAAGVLLDDGSVALADGRRIRDGSVVEDGSAAGNGTAVENGSGTATVRGENIREVFAVVETDEEGVGEGELNTTPLRPVAVDLNLFAGASNATAAVAVYETADGEDEIHQRSLRITEAEVTLAFESPGESYVAGEAVAVEGTVESGGEGNGSGGDGDAAGAVDAVAVYVSDGDAWTLVEPSLADLPVDEDGSWGRTAVALSEDAPLLRTPGTYRLGAIPVAEADRDGDGRADDGLTAEEFAGGSAVERAIEVVEPTVTGGIETYGGEVAEEDATHNVSGTARGAMEVAVVFVDHRGGTVVGREPVDEDWVYADDEFELEDDDGELAEGRVVGLVVAAGPDAVFGRGSESPDSIYELVEYVNALEDEGMTQDQVVALVREATVMDEGSDDLGNATEFTYTGADVTVLSVDAGDGGDAAIPQVEPGGDVEVTGRTNLRPGRNAIDVELRRRATGPAVETTTVDDWDRDGNWTATLTVPGDVAPGDYELRVDAGVVAVPIPIEVVGQPADSSGAADSGTTTEGTTETTTATTEVETTGTTTANGTTTEEDGTTTEEETTTEDGTTTEDETTTEGTTAEGETTEDETTTTESETPEETTEDETTTTEETSEETDDATTDGTETTTDTETGTAEATETATSTETVTAEAAGIETDAGAGTEEVTETATGAETTTEAETTTDAGTTTEAETTTDAGTTTDSEPGTAATSTPNATADGDSGVGLDRDVSLSPGQVGFGVGLTVVALVVAALLAARRF